MKKKNYSKSDSGVEGTKNYLEIKILHFTSIIRLCVVKIPQSLHLHATINSAIPRQRYTWVVYIWKHWLEYSSPYTFHKSITDCLRYYTSLLLLLRKLQLNGDGVREKKHADQIDCDVIQLNLKKVFIVWDRQFFFHLTISFSLISEDLIAKLTEFNEGEVKGLIMRSSLCNYNFFKQILDLKFNFTVKKN